MLITHGYKKRGASLEEISNSPLAPLMDTRAPLQQIAVTRQICVVPCREQEGKRTWSICSCPKAEAKE